jgi:hypothetical protein
MKTGQEYFDMMDAETQAKFKANLRGNFKPYLKRNFYDLHEFLMCAFSWIDTPEGFHFWNNLMKSKP